MTVHILNQYVWPDNSPTAVYSEQLAVCLIRHGYTARLVGGTGSYRQSNRADPGIPIIKLPTRQGKRGGILSTFTEYLSVNAAFKKYLRAEVQPHDIVIISSAPPNTIGLWRTIRARQARAIYWLQDYYPDLLRGLINYPKFIRSLLALYWSSELRHWDKVVKIAGNLYYSGSNACIVRNWPTTELGAPQPFEPKTAVYFGNLGYGHSLPLFLELCSSLRDQGYTVTLVGDGPKVSRLPDWIEKRKPESGPAFAALLWRAEMHLVAADPEITGAIFPSKYWTSRSTGRTIMTSGFGGSMLEELNYISALKELPSPEDWLPVIKSV